MEFEPGKIYVGYHDGKRSESRRVEIKITNVINRADFSKQAIRLWKRAVREDFDSVFNGCCFYFTHDGSLTKQFWDWNCETFYEGYIVGDKDTQKDKMLFAKSYDGYYCVNWNFELTTELSNRTKGESDGND